MVEFSQSRVSILQDGKEVIGYGGGHASCLLLYACTYLHSSISHCLSFVMPGATHSLSMRRAGCVMRELGYV